VNRSSGKCYLGLENEVSTQLTTQYKDKAREPHCPQCILLGGETYFAGFDRKRSRSVGFIEW